MGEDDGDDDYDVDDSDEDDEEGSEPEVTIEGSGRSLVTNIGDRQGHLAAAVTALTEHGVRVLASSSLYETEPVGLVLDQPDFLNACLQIETELGPEELLDVGKRVEAEVGRRAGGVRH